MTDGSEDWEHVPDYFNQCSEQSWVQLYVVVISGGEGRKQIEKRGERVRTLKGTCYRMSRVLTVLI